MPSSSCWKRGTRCWAHDPLTLVHQTYVHRQIAILLLLLPLAGSAPAQVQVVLSAKSFKVRETIRAKVMNDGKVPVTYCVEFGQHSPKGDTIESTPIPFYVQRRQDGKWSTLLIGPDIGSMQSPVVLEPGKSQEFPFRLTDAGEMRLVLRYWVGALEKLDCPNPQRQAKTRKSPVFSLSR